MYLNSSTELSGLIFQLSVNYQVINIVCINRRKQLWITTGDEQLTRFVPVMYAPVSVPTVKCMSYFDLHDKY